MADLRTPHLSSDAASAIERFVNSSFTEHRAEAQADSTAPDVATMVADFNALLAALRTAKLLSE